MVVGALPTNMPSTSMSAPGWLALMLKVAVLAGAGSMAGAIICAGLVAEALLTSTGLADTFTPAGRPALLTTAPSGVRRVRSGDCGTRRVTSGVLAAAAAAT